MSPSTWKPLEYRRYTKSARLHVWLETGEANWSARVIDSSNTLVCECLNGFASEREAMAWADLRASQLCPEAP